MIALRAMVLLGIVLISIPDYALGQAKMISVELRLSKKRYLRSQSIYAEAVLRNHSSEPLTINPFSIAHQYLTFVVRDESGKEYPDKIHRYLVGTDSLGAIIGPHDSVYAQLNLSTSHAPGERMFRYLQSKTYFPTGRYDIQAIFESGRGQIKSDVRSVTVEEPTGKEINALTMYIQAETYQVNHQFDRSIEVLDSLIEMFPKSVYLSSAYVQQFRIYEYDLRSRNDLLKKACDLLEQDPTNDAAYDGLTYLLTRPGSGDGLMNRKHRVLAMLRDKFPKAETGRRSKLFLDRESKQK